MASPRPPGSFRIPSQRRPFERLESPVRQRQYRIRRILDSIRSDLEEGGTARVRLILKDPRELYRLELELPEMAYQRTTILDREALTALLEHSDESLLRERLTIR